MNVSSNNHFTLGHAVRFERLTVENGLSDNSVRAILQDRWGFMWFGTWNGLNRYDGYSFKVYKKNPDNPNSVSDNLISVLCEDADGTLWIGTGSGELNKFDPVTERFTRYRHIPGDSTSFCGSFVLSLCQDCVGNLWIGTLENGLDKFDPHTGIFVHYRHRPDDPHSLSKGAVTSIVEDETKRLWVGTLGGGLNKFDPITGIFVHYRLDLEKECFHVYWPYPAAPESMDNQIRVLCQGQAGGMWLGSWYGGLSHFDPEIKHFRHYRHNPLEKTSLVSDTIYALCQTQEGTLWVGTSGGLCKFEPEAETFVHYLERDGLPSDAVRGILEDDAGNLWLSTMQGVSKFDPQTETFRNYDVYDGLQGNVFHDTSYCKTRRGELFFGGMQGVNTFYPDDVLDNPYIPPIIITEFLLFNKPVVVGGDSLLQKAIWATDKITLGPEDYVFAFEFAALSYTAPVKNRYKYKLEGFDQDWNEVTSRRRFVSYSSLPAGDYVFRVIGSNHDGVWNNVGASLRITVKPPVWEKLRSEKEAAEAANRAKSIFLASISHELRTPLNAILGFSELLSHTPGLTRQQRENLDIIGQSGEHLLALINDVLDLSKIEAGKTEMQFQVFDLHELLMGLSHMFRMPAEGKGLYLHIDWDDDVPRYIRADAGKLRQVLINLLGNAVKFTEQGGVTVRVMFPASDWR